MAHRNPSIGTNRRRIWPTALQSTDRESLQPDARTPIFMHLAASAANVANDGQSAFHHQNGSSAVTVESDRELSAVSQQDPPYSLYGRTHVRRRISFYCHARGRSDAAAGPFDITE